MQNSTQAQWIAALLLVSSSLENMAINISYWCLVRSWTSAGTHRFLAGLFTFLSMWPIVSWLGAGGRNWFRTIITTMKKTSQFSAFVFHDILPNCKMWSVLQTFRGKLTRNDTGRRPPLTSLDATHPGLAAVKVDIF